jgi:hypothetical protein
LAVVVLMRIYYSTHAKYYPHQTLWLPSGFVNLQEATENTNGILEYIFFEEYISLIDMNGESVGGSLVRDKKFIISYRGEYYTYDANSNISTYKDRNGTTLEYIYDSMDQPMFIIARNPDGTYGGSKVFYHARNGQLEYMQWVDSSSNYTYDNHGRLKTELVRGILKTYTYNTGDQVTGFTMSKNNTTQLSLGYAYDNMGRLSSVSNNCTVVANYTAYDKNHNLRLPIPYRA